MSTTFLRVLMLALALFASSSHSAQPKIDDLIQQELAAEDRGDLSGAIDRCREILRIDPKHVATLNALAGLYGKLGKFNAEIMWAQRAIEVDARFHLAYVNLGNAQLSLKQHGHARESYSKAVQLAPTDPIPVYSLGVLEEEEHHLLEAIAAYEQSVRVDPKFEPGLFSLAAMYANAKRFDDALATLDKLLAISPDSRDAREMKAQIVLDRSSTR